ncbi:hypothetical protein J437_LFUL019124 [Ladona fulva]|uniref:Uncharacterized protein n=1 Tax=Ladona fulva TaxID=123851 RepID=A0A8K0PC08_LADFU|nr:hypothetical protein J437_LFUL019124 [Ladona fulva]
MQGHDRHAPDDSSLNYLQRISNNSTVRKGAAFKRIAKDSSPTCPIKLADLEAHFSLPPPPTNTGPTPSTVPEIDTTRQEGQERSLLRPVTSIEVLDRIKRTANSTSGLDGIPYQTWPK